MRRCARASRASRCGVVIGPRGAATTISKGASQPGPTARSIASVLWRAGLELGSSWIPGAPVLKARAGAASSASGTAISAAARAGRRRARVGGGGDPGSPALAARRLPIAPELIRSPSSASRGGSAIQAIATLIGVTTTSAVASESSSDPGCRNDERRIEVKSVAPANSVVRPAVRLVIRAASHGGVPRASSSRKRETMKSE